MNTNYNIGTANINSLTQETTVKNDIDSFKNKTDLKDAAIILDSITNKGMINKPFVSTTNQVTFNDNGTITLDSRNMTVQGGKVQFGKPVYVDYPLDETQSETKQKEHFVNSAVENSKNILNCTFLVKDDEGNPTQISIQGDKKNPYNITVSTRNDFESEFEPQTNNTFNKLVGTPDDAIKTVIKQELEKYGIEDLAQFAISTAK